VWNHLVQEYPAWRVAATFLLVVVVPVLLTWRLLVDNLWIGLTGRVWIFRGSLLAFGIGLTFASVVLAELISKKSDLFEQIRAGLVWWASGAVLLKLLVTGGLVRAILRRGLLKPATLVRGLGLWLLVTAGLFVLAWAAVRPDWVPVSWLALGAVLCVPLARIVAAPLALAWNRHR
jgi:hypothetical protein